VLNPRQEWTVRQDERLRMVSNDLWQRAKRRQAEQAEQDERIGERIKAGTSKGVFSSVQGHFRLPRASYRESYC
jgi:hypothetical protein